MATDFLAEVRAWIDRLGLTNRDAAQLVGTDAEELAQVLEGRSANLRLRVILEILDRLGLGLVDVHPSTPAMVLRHLEACQKRKGISQRVLAKKANLERTNMAKLLRDEDPDPNLETVLKLAEALECSLSIGKRTLIEASSSAPAPAPPIAPNNAPGVKPVAVDQAPPNQAQIDALSAELEGIRGQRDTLRRERDAARQERDQAIAELEVARAELAPLQELPSALAAAQLALAVVGKERDQAQQDVAGLMAENQRLRGELVQRDQNAGEAARQAEGLRVELAAARAERDLALNDAEDLRAQVEQLQGRHGPLQDALDAAKVAQRELEKQLAAAVSERSRLQHERDQARRQTEEHERAIAALGRKIDTLTANLGAARTAAAEAREELEIKEQLVARLRVMYKHKSCEVRVRRHYTRKGDEAVLAPIIAKAISECVETLDADDE